jgi:hypothetical protein
MARIPLSADATVARVMNLVRETFESRDYVWEQSDPENATASEGGKPIGDAATVVSQRLRVAVHFDTRKHRLVLTQETIGAAYSAVGAGYFYVKLAARYRKMVKAIRDDLAAASLH